MPALSWRARALALFAAIGLVVPPPAHGQDLGTGRRVQGTALITAVEVGDVPGHVVGVVEFKGLTFFADGEIATHANPATFDLTHGSGPHQGYVVHYFDDGSTGLGPAARASPDQRGEVPRSPRKVKHTPDWRFAQGPQDA
jgi:hypothetical protein